MYVLITGSSSGIGMELAKLFASNGYDLILVSRSLKEMEKLKKKLKTSSNTILIKPKDLSIIDNCNTLFEEVKTLDIGIWINNAGYGNLGDFSNTDIKLEQNMLNLNIHAIQTLMKLYVRHYKQGVVVNVSSMAAFLPTPSFATYAASKAYVYNLSRAVNYELKMQKKPIKVLTVAPGPVKTKFNERANAAVNRGMDVVKCSKIIYRGVQKRKELIIPGFTMKLLHLLIRFVPTKLLLKSAYKIQNSK